MISTGTHQLAQKPSTYSSIRLERDTLTLRIPLAPHAKPRKIAISGSTARQLTA